MSQSDFLELQAKARKLAEDICAKLPTKNAIYQETKVRAALKKLLAGESDAQSDPRHR